MRFAKSVINIRLVRQYTRNLRLIQVTCEIDVSKEQFMKISVQKDTGDTCRKYEAAWKSLLCVQRQRDGKDVLGLPDKRVRNEGDQ
jgi:hypothetical protein